jgi:hypothetical protein
MNEGFVSAFFPRILGGGLKGHIRVSGGDADLRGATYLDLALNEGRSFITRKTGHFLWSP